MYAIAIDLKTSNSYNGAYDEIRLVLKKMGFERIHDGLYISREESDALTPVYKAINKLANIEWFRRSVSDIRTFRVEDWSDFTDIIRGDA